MVEAGESEGYMSDSNPRTIDPILRKGVCCDQSRIISKNGSC